jgi:ribosomal protein S27AE
MSDLIDRQAAVDALGEKPLAWTEDEYELGLQQQWEADVDAIKAVPSARPERKGKWIELEPKGVWTSVYHCSECGGAVMSCKVDLPKYCGHCGADMRGERNG